MNAIQTADKKLNTEAAAKVIGVKKQTLNIWRSQRKGPPYFKIGTLVFYMQSDLEQWVSQRRIDPEA